MQRKIFISASLIGIITVIIFMSSFKTIENQQKDYMTIVGNMPLKQIIVSQPGKDVQIIEVDKKINPFDFETTLQLIKKYESEGWEVESNTFSSAGNLSLAVNYFYLTKEIE